MTGERQTDAGGPYLQTALFCERVMEEKDGVLSAIRIVDRLIQTAVGVGTPDVMPPMTVGLTLLITLKSGAARGRHDLTVTAEQPSGLRRQVVGPVTVMMEGEERGANLVFRLEWQAQQEGLYWWDVELDNQRLTRVPLRIVYQRQETAQAPGPGGAG